MIPTRGWGRLVQRQEWTLAILVIAAAFAAAHGQRARANYAAYQWEDRVFIEHNQNSIGSVRDCFTERPVWPGLYRPLTTNLYYFLGRKAFANDVRWHHTINIVFHLANGFLLYLLCLHLLPRWWTLLPPAIFVSRISHVEVVNNTCEFQTLLSVFFTLLAMVFCAKGLARARRVWLVLSLTAFLLALFSKETALVYPALALAFGWLFDDRLRSGSGRRSAWADYLAPAAVAGAWIVLFVTIFRAVTDYRPTGFRYDFSLSGVLANYAAYSLSFFNVLTYRVESVVMMPGISAWSSGIASKATFAVVALFVVAFVIFYRGPRSPWICRMRVVVLGASIFVVATSPYVILVSRQFMRYGYFGHAGLAIAAGAGVREVALAAGRIAAGRSRLPAPQPR